MYLRNGATGWSAFDSFWRDESDSAIWSPPDQNSGSGAWGGHAEICVGYYDDPNDSSKSYWVILNSWGAPANRPHGTWRLAMDDDINFGPWNCFQTVTL